MTFKDKTKGRAGVARQSEDPARVREKIPKQVIEEFARISFEWARASIELPNGPASARICSISSLSRTSL
jgi:hypothetical protein